MLQLPALSGSVSSTYMHRIGGELTALLARLIISGLPATILCMLCTLYATQQTQQRRCLLIKSMQYDVILGWVLTPCRSRLCKGSLFSLGSDFRAVLDRTGPRCRKTLTLSALALGRDAFPPGTCSRHSSARG
ncbi:hypothetical protein F5Y00DRAFT_231503 [Daldinia vernicosa]|uniref:uncharacterized protein n=1 Tax=Daldinia vernicosa TaxID=114800 RepID=UPI002007A4AD|nr:uncharacterized protein F5Y00DRAFT_231503 [Daldinia vernicosa]KAI0851023.1 hypothetical protein F5Y00DRAFT_231503 [Daldinia vernicosa]